MKELAEFVATERVKPSKAILDTAVCMSDWELLDVIRKAEVDYGKTIRSIAKDKDYKLAV